MITFEDCEAFCEASPAVVEAVTRREHVAGIALREPWRPNIPSRRCRRRSS